MPPTYKMLRAEAETALLQARHALMREIADYPAPISGCDAQFNHLLAERQRLAGALDHLRQPVFIPTPRQPEPGQEARAR